MSILAVNAGAAYHIASLEGPRYKQFFDRIIRPRELATVDLSDFDLLLIPCRTPSYHITPHAERIRAFLDHGGTVVAMGECHSERWLPGITFDPCPTNYWWWLDPKGDLGTRIVKPEHELFRRIGEADIRWHLHGFFDPPAGAEILATGPGERPILYVDEVTTPGRMIVTSLDPFGHHGANFMPATTRFLDGFLPWLAEIRTKALR